MNSLLKKQLSPWPSLAFRKGRVRWLDGRGWHRQSNQLPYLCEMPVLHWELTFVVNHCTLSLLPGEILLRNYFRFLKALDTQDLRSWPHFFVLERELNFCNGYLSLLWFWYRLSIHIFYKFLEGICTKATWGSFSFQRANWKHVDCNISCENMGLC